MEFRARRTSAGPEGSAVNAVHHHHHHHYVLCDGNNGSNQRRLLSSSNSSSNINTLNGSQQVRRPSNIPAGQGYASIKTLSLSNLTAKQHLLLAVCRDVSLLPPLIYIFSSVQQAWRISFRTKLKLYELQSLRDTMKVFVQSCIANNSISHANEMGTNGNGLLLSTLTTARASEYLLCALWCVVSLYLTYSILDSLMVRWIVKYSTVAAIVRMFAMSLLIITTELLLLASLSPNGDYYLHTWILVSCIMTAAYIWQSYLTSNLSYVSQEDSDFDDQACNVTGKEPSPTDLDDISSSNASLNSLPSSYLQQKRKNRKKPRRSIKFTTKRTIDLYNIIVFCVVPVGLASFITMVGLLRNLVIQRLDVEQLGRMLQSAH